MPFRFLVAVAASFPALATALPSVASINLCTDQLVLSVAAPEQILTVSWLATDPEESMLADRARAYPVNYGSAEEILRFAPDVVVAGSYTGAFTRRLLGELGYEVVEIEPANDLDDIARNIRIVARALEREAEGEALVDAMRERARRIEANRPAVPLAAVVVRPGGFTVGARSLADSLMALAGLRNVAAEQGLDRWGSLSLETLIVSRPDLLIVTDYRRGELSLANSVFEHPTLRRLAGPTDRASLPGKYWGCGIPESLVSAEILQTLGPVRERAGAVTARADMLDADPMPIEPTEPGRADARTAR